MSGEDEYEIESILEARVEKKKGRKAKLAWKFRVRWKGYSPGDDTWEPMEHLVGSEETLSRFWERINTNGRDYRDLQSFKAGEEFLPVGPPKKRKVKENDILSVKDAEFGGETVETTSEIGHAPLSRPRKREHDVDTDVDVEHSTKRPKPTSQVFGSKPSLLLTNPSTPVKASPSDILDLTLQQATDLVPLQTPTSDFGSKDGEPASPDSMRVDLPTSTRNTALHDVPTPPSAKNVQPSMPLHRARTANPLVKILSDHHLASFKSHESNQEKSSQKQMSPPRRRPGPGRSSDGLLIRPATLLTAEKGKLKSVRGKDHHGGRTRANGTVTKDDNELSFKTTEATINREDPVQPPEPSEILELAGLDPSSGGLPDYDDEVTMESSVSEAVELERSDPAPPPATGSLFPSIIPTSDSSIMWKRSTIFGPLGLGTDAPNSQGSMDANDPATPFQLTLDSSTVVPVLFVDVVPPSAFNNSALSQRGPPGKFYRGMYARELLGTLRTKGSFARVLLPKETTNSDQNVNFKHFAKRLAGDELFVAMVDRDLLAFCSSNNALFVQRLNIPPSSITTESTLVAHVSIEDYSAFADAAANADDTIWSQYVLSKVDV